VGKHFDALSAVHGIKTWPPGVCISCSEKELTG